jgi:hypothetical protein
MLGMITYSSDTEQWQTDTTHVRTEGYSVDPVTGYHLVSSQGIPAAQLGDTLWLRVYALLNDGSYVCSQAVPYSIAQYAGNLLKKGPDTFKPVCVALLNYGAAAQIHQDYKTDFLMNADLSEQQQALTAAYQNVLDSEPAEIDRDRLENFQYSQHGDPDQRFSYDTEEALTIHCRLTHYKAPQGALLLYYWDQKIALSNEPLTAENASGIITASQASNHYRASIPNIQFKDLAQHFYICFSDIGNGGSYCSGVIPVTMNVYLRDISSPYLQDLINAAAIFSACADAYFP